MAENGKSFACVCLFVKCCLMTVSASLICAFACVCALSPSPTSIFKLERSFSSMKSKITEWTLVNAPYFIECCKLQEEAHLCLRLTSRTEMLLSFAFLCLPSSTAFTYIPTTIWAAIKQLTDTENVF